MKHTMGFFTSYDTLAIAAIDFNNSDLPIPRIGEKVDFLEFMRNPINNEPIADNEPIPFDYYEVLDIQHSYSYDKNDEIFDYLQILVKPMMEDWNHPER